MGRLSGEAFPIMASGLPDGGGELPQDFTQNFWPNSPNLLNSRTLAAARSGQRSPSISPPTASSNQRPCSAPVSTQEGKRSPDLPDFQRVDPPGRPADIQSE